VATVEARTALNLDRGDLMAKSKSDLHADAVSAGRLSDLTDPEDFTVEELQELMSDDKPAWKGSRSSKEPIVYPDGHVALSAEDIKARDA
jgi:hypothetical protein